VSASVVFSPAKINLFLAITGRRADGFHDLVSVVAPLKWGDTLRIEVDPQGRDLVLTCDEVAVPRDESNLVLRAARAFCAAVQWNVGLRFHLSKKIPMGAGLGGGSSNAAATLRALNGLAPAPLTLAALAALAAQIGSDCALFLHDAPVVMRGRGERVERLDAAAAGRLSGRRVLVFKPAFAIATPWAYAQLAALAKDAEGIYLPSRDAELRLAAWTEDARAPAERLLFNNLEAPAFSKYIALPALLDRLSGEFGLNARMSGSGSACFALLPEGAPVDKIATLIRSAWGPSSLVIESAIA
jgi:4-diphosphocytidyl-2-C-methyl-D-erythritol kinase